MAAVVGKRNVSSQSSKYLRGIMLFLCLIGLCISIFGLYIEILKESNPNYVPFCDINTYVACSRALTSRYGKGFGIVDKFVSNTSFLNQPNTVYGIAFYTFQASMTISSTSSAAVVQTFLSILANIGSIYLGYILYYIIRDFCLVCVSTYIVNFFLLIACLFRLKQAVSQDIKKTVRKKNHNSLRNITWNESFDMHKMGFSYDSVCVCIVLMETFFLYFSAVTTHLKQRRRLHMADLVDESQ